MASATPRAGRPGAWRLPPPRAGVGECLPLVPGLRERGERATSQLRPRGCAHSNLASELTVNGRLRGEWRASPPRAGLQEREESPPGAATAARGGECHPSSRASWSVASATSSSRGWRVPTPRTGPEGAWRACHEPAQATRLCPLQGLTTPPRVRRCQTHRATPDPPRDRQRRLPAKIVSETVSRIVSEYRQQRLSAEIVSGDCQQRLSAETTSKDCQREPQRGLPAQTGGRRRRLLDTPRGE